MRNRRRAGNKNPTTSNGINWDLVVKFTGAIVAVATLAFGIVQYHKRTELELQKRKVELYFQAMDSTSGFAMATTPAQADEARARFWRLYNGQLSAVESNNVKTAMEVFGGAVRSWEQYNQPPSDFSTPATFEYFPDGDDKPSVSLAQLSYRLTQICRAELGTP
jgi:hypothetical protein